MPSKIDGNNSTSESLPNANDFTVEEIIRTGNKTVGASSGHIAEGGGKKYMVKSSPTEGGDASLRDLVIEFIVGPTFKIILGDRAPNITLVRTSPDNQENAAHGINSLSISSEFIDGFRTLSDIYKDPSYADYKLQGFAQILMASLFCGDMDINKGNIGAIKKENAYFAAKIDHGRSLYRFFTDPKDILSNLSVLLGTFNLQEHSIDMDECIKAIKKIIENKDKILKSITNRVTLLAEIGINLNEIYYNFTISEDTNKEYCYQSYDELSDFLRYTQSKFTEDKNSRDIIALHAAEYFRMKFSRQIEIFEQLKCLIEDFQKIDLPLTQETDAFLFRDWVKGLSSQDPILYAHNNNYTIEGQNPILWAIIHNRTIDDKHPIVFYEGQNRKTLQDAEIYNVPGKKNLPWFFWNGYFKNFQLEEKIKSRLTDFEIDNFQDPLHIMDKILEKRKDERMILYAIEKNFSKQTLVDLIIIYIRNKIFIDFQEKKLDIVKFLYEKKVLISGKNIYEWIIQNFTKKLYYDIKIFFEIEENKDFFHQFASQCRIPEEEKLLQNLSSKNPLLSINRENFRAANNIIHATENEDSIIYAIEKGLPIFGIDPMKFVEIFNLKMVNQDIILYLINSQKQIKNQDPLLYAIIHNIPINRIDPLLFALKNGLKINGIPAFEYAIKHRLCHALDSLIKATNLNTKDRKLINFSAIADANILIDAQNALGWMKIRKIPYKGTKMLKYQNSIELRINMGMPFDDLIENADLSNLTLANGVRAIDWIAQMLKMNPSIKIFNENPIIYAYKKNILIQGEPALAWAIYNNTHKLAKNCNLLDPKVVKKILITVKQDGEDVNLDLYNYLIWRKLYINEEPAEIFLIRKGVQFKPHEINKNNILFNNKYSSENLMIAAQHNLLLRSEKDQNEVICPVLLAIKKGFLFDGKDPLYWALNRGILVSTNRMNPAKYLLLHNNPKYRAKGFAFLLELAKNHQKIDSAISEDKMYTRYIDPILYAQKYNLKPASTYDNSNHSRKDAITFALLKNIYIDDKELANYIKTHNYQIASEVQNINGINKFEWMGMHEIRINSQDPFVYAQKNGHLIEGRNPLLYAALKGYKIEGNNPKQYFREKGLIARIMTGYKAKNCTNLVAR